MKPRVYVVEDNGSVRAVLAMMLDSCGYQFEGDEDGRKLLDRDTYLDLACIIMDVNLPGESGLQILAKLRQKFVRTPVLIATAQVSENLKREADGLDVTGFLEKPFRRGELKEAIGRCVDGAWT